MFKKLWHKIQVIIRWASIWIYRITRFLTHDIFYLREQDFSRWKGRLVKDAKTVILMLTTFSAQKIGYQVTALAYRSMMSVVPAIAIAFYLTSGVGLKDMFKDILLTNLGDTRITEVLMNAADNIVDVAQSGLFGFISMQPQHRLIGTFFGIPCPPRPFLLTQRFPRHPRIRRP